MRWLSRVATVAALGASLTVPARAQIARTARLSPADRADAARRLIALLHTDPASSGGLYDAQQEGMALAFAVFTFGSAAEQEAVLDAAAARVEALPTAGELAANDVVSEHIGAIELLSPTLTKARQRIGRLAFAIDRLPLPSGPASRRRVFPIVDDGKINVMSEVEMQYAYLLSTILRLAVEHPLPPGDTLRVRRRAATSSLFTFLLHDKVGFYWEEVPGWHWSGPFRNMRERVMVKLAGTERRVTQPPWFGAIVDHELHLFGVAGDLSAAARQDGVLRALMTRADAAMLDEIRATTLRMLRTRVTSGPRHDGFLIDYGYWTSNPSYAYAGCSQRSPMPSAPCPVDSVATDASHARRWPWWLESMKDAWPAHAAARAEIEGYQSRLATQFATVVLHDDGHGRPLTRNYMDGKDGWYSLKDSPAKKWGYSPSSMTGALRYGSWAMLARFQPAIGSASRSFCDILASTDSADVLFRTRYYGSASDRPELGGLGEKDLYGAASGYTLICRIGSALGYYATAARVH